MFDIVLQSFLSSIPVYIFFALGYLIRRRGMITAAQEPPILQLAMDVAYPCLIFFNIMKYMVLEPNEKVSSLSFTLQAIGCGFIELLVGVAAAYLVARMLRLRIGTGLRTFSLTAGMQNYVFFAVPVIQMLSTSASDPTMGVLFVHNVGCDIFIWSLGIFFLTGSSSQLRMAMLVRGPMLAVIISLAVVWSGLGPYIALPPIMRTTEMLGSVATPICLIIFGCSIYDLTRNFKWQPRLISAGLITRLLIAPALILLIAWALPIDPLIKRIMVIQSAIPSAVVSIILARRFGGVPEVGTQVLLSTSIVAFLTLPLWLTLGNLFVVPLR